MGDRARILIVDDDAAVGRVLVALLAQAKHDARHALDADAALRVLEREPFDAVLSDVRMPGKSGMDLLDAIGAKWPDVPVLLLTAYGTIPLAVEAMKRGAADFLLKPFDRDELLFALDKAMRKARHAPPASALASTSFGSTSAAMREVERVIALAAKGNATVLIRGETGTGKGLAARVLHDASARRDAPFVAVQCGALPETLIESELFGYEKGAFTGATCRKPGRVELAKGGTLFLDEIGDVPLAVQAKLLRLVQDKHYERLGGTETLSADVRLVAATHQPLEELVARRAFREDLFYRLNVVPLAMPALRDRPEDVEPLARAFAARFAALHARPDVTLASSAIARLRVEAWPGNVRQLENQIERLVVLAERPTIEADDVERALGASPRGGSIATSAAETRDAPLALDATRREAERAALERALEKAGGNRSLAARLLGVSRRTLYNKLEELGIA